MFRLCSTYVSTFSTKNGYVLTRLVLCFDSLDRNRVCFDFVFDLKLLFDRGIELKKPHMLDFQSRNISRAPYPGNEPKLH